MAAPHLVHFRGHMPGGFACSSRHSRNENRRPRRAGPVYSDQYRGSCMRAVTSDRDTTLQMPQSASGQIAEFRPYQSRERAARMSADHSFRSGSACDRASPAMLAPSANTANSAMTSPRFSLPRHATPRRGGRPPGLARRIAMLVLPARSAAGPRPGRPLRPGGGDAQGRQQRSAGRCAAGTAPGRRRPARGRSAPNSPGPGSPSAGPAPSPPPGGRRRERRPPSTRDNRARGRFRPVARASHRHVPTPGPHNDRLADQQPVTVAGNP
jgi:hypothetical protein